MSSPETALPVRSRFLPARRALPCALALAAASPRPAPAQTEFETLSVRGVSVAPDGVALVVGGRLSRGDAETLRADAGAVFAVAAAPSLAELAAIGTAAEIPDSAAEWDVGPGCKGTCGTVSVSIPVARDDGSAAAVYAN